MSKKIIWFSVMLSINLSPALWAVIPSPLQQGMERLRKRSENPPKLVPEALALFQKGLEKTPRDEKLMAAELHTYTLMGGYGLMPTGEACDEAGKLAVVLENKALVSPEKQFALGRWRLWCQDDLKGAVPYFEKAGEQTSFYQKESLFSLASIQLFRSDNEKCRQTLNRIRSLSGSENEPFIWFDLYLKDYDAVLKQTAALLEKNPQHRNALSYRARAYLALGLEQKKSDPKKSKVSFENADKLFKTLETTMGKPTPNVRAESVIANAFLNRETALHDYQSLKLLADDAVKKHQASPVLHYRLAQIASALGLNQEAEKHFQASVDAKESNFMWVAIDPLLKELRDTSAVVKKKMTEIGLTHS